MKVIRFAPGAIAVLVVSLFCASQARAQATRTWLSGVGDDANPCSRTAPCKTWAGTISKTTINGEMNILDPGSYGSLTITKSITVDGNGFQAATTAGGSGVIINIVAGNPDDPHRSVRLRNLSITGMGVSGTVGTRTGLDGIRFIAGTSLFVENVTVHEFSGDGIDIAGQVGEANFMNVVLDNVLVRNINGSGVRATHLNATGQIVLLATNLRVYSANVGVDASNRTRVGIKEGVFTHNTIGLKQSGSDNIMNLDDIFVSYGTTGLESSAGNTIRLSDSIVMQNGTGLNTNGGTILSLNGNTVSGNTVDGAFNGVGVPKT